MARTIELIYAGVYDGETYLVWTRGESPDRD